MHMSMPSVLKYSSGNASYVLWRPETKWGWKCSILVMGSFTLMVLMVLSGCAATNARKLTTWSVLLQKKKKTSSSPFFAPLMSVGSRDEVKQVTLKRVIFLFTVARQKITKKKVRRAKDGRAIAPRKTASAGRDKKEQLWKVEDLDRAFDLWEKKKDLPPKERLSKNKIAKGEVVQEQDWKGNRHSLCERLSGRHGGGKRGKIAGGKQTAKVLKSSKFKRVTLSDFKRVMMRAGNRPLENLYNTPFPLCLP